MSQFLWGRSMGIPHWCFYQSLARKSSRYGLGLQSSWAPQGKICFQIHWQWLQALRDCWQETSGLCHTRLLTKAALLLPGWGREKGVVVEKENQRSVFLLPFLGCDTPLLALYSVCQKPITRCSPHRWVGVLGPSSRLSWGTTLPSRIAMKTSRVNMCKALSTELSSPVSRCKM